MTFSLFWNAATRDEEVEAERPATPPPVLLRGTIEVSSLISSVLQFSPLLSKVAGVLVVYNADGGLDDEGEENMVLFERAVACECDRLRILVNGGEWSGVVVSDCRLASCEDTVATSMLRSACER